VDKVLIPSIMLVVLVDQVEVEVTLAILEARVCNLGRRNQLAQKEPTIITEVQVLGLMGVGALMSL
jgi:hypothetical protein